MAYADYGYYQTEYLGNALPEDDFPCIAERASDYIDYLTLGRAAGYADHPQVKKCCCALAECFQILENAKAAANEAEIKSESVGTWSMSYVTSADMASAYQDRLYPVAQQYLLTTGLLYRGSSSSRRSRSKC